MKKLLLALSLLATCSTPSYAALNCAEQAFLAKSVMEIRQKGTDIATFMTAMDIMKADTDEQKEGVRFMKAIAPVMFSVHVATSDKYKEKHIKEAGNRVYLKCLESKN